ncbi:MAG TPA: hypothetical protein ENK18_17785 [Deltaproteobacteria bacterium]|nr:hypothetical protein [Deltaproteobacteria bacterium]
MAQGGSTPLHPHRDDLDDIATELVNTPYLRVSEEGRYILVDPTLPPRSAGLDLPGRRRERPVRGDVLVAWCATALMVALSWVMLLALSVLLAASILLT